MNEFDEIRPYVKGEMKDALSDLLKDRHFNIMMRGLVPWLPRFVRNTLFRLAFIGIDTPQDFQIRFMKPVVNYVLRKYANGASFDSNTVSNQTAYTSISNHRDIARDSAIP